ncbi:GNAT family N-acetyltransferase [Streptomyces sp. NPDC054842]
MTITGDAVTGIVRAWVDGWVVSRGAAPPVVGPWGFTIDVGLPDHVTRHVLAATGDAVREAAVREVADAVTGTGVWLKVFAEPAAVGPWLGDGWWVDPVPGFLMTAPLTATGPADAGPGNLMTAPPTAACPAADAGPGILMTAPLTATGPAAEAAPSDGAHSPPDGYRLRTWSRGGVGHALVLSADGSWAAHGHVAPTGATAVFDRIETAPAHRRRGLGRLVMRALTGLAVAAGAGTGVLAGTPDGRALYESLGWRVDAPLTSARFTG